MLRSTCILFITLLCFSASNAQSVRSLQLKAGLNKTMITGGSTGKFVMGFYIGVAKEIPLSKHVSFQPEIFYSLQGNDSHSDIYRYHYVQMPLYLNFHIGRRGGIALGPQIGLLSRAKLVTSRDQTYIVTPFMNLFDLQLGGGPYLTFGRLKADVRITMGMTPVDREDDQLRSLGFQAGVSWSITKPVDE